MPGFVDVDLTQSEFCTVSGKPLLCIGQSYVDCFAFDVFRCLCCCDPFGSLFFRSVLRNCFP